MRVVSALVLGFAMGVVQPAFAKGPAWHSQVLDQPTRFGKVELKAGAIGLYSSGRAAHGTLARPLPLTRTITLPEESIVAFLDDEYVDAPYFPAAAAVPGTFAACGFAFGPEPPDEAGPLVKGVWVPKGFTPIRLPYGSEAERLEQPDSVNLAGRLLYPTIAEGLSLPAGSELWLRCGPPGPTLGAWTGLFEHDTDVGGVMLRAHQSAGVAFTLLGPHPTSGTLVGPYVTNGRSLPAGTRMELFEGGMIVNCPGGKTSVLLPNGWISKDCGVDLPSDGATQFIAPSASVASIRPRASKSSSEWLVLFALGAVGLALSIVFLRAARTS